jgi:hypothetical protein
VARDLGGWRPEYFVTDLDLWLRMAFRTRFVKIPEVLSAMRVHGEQRDREISEIWHSYWAVIEDSDDIRRSDWRTRLAARSGRRLFTQYYNPSSSPRSRSAQMWLALLMYPPSVRAVRDWRLLLPYSGSLRASVSRRASRVKTQTSTEP